MCDDRYYELVGDIDPTNTRLAAMRQLLREPDPEARPSTGENVAFWFVYTTLIVLLALLAAIVLRG